MNPLRWMLCCAALAAACERADAAVTFTTTHAEGRHDLDGMMSNSDAIHGLIAQELEGDQGWHPANPAANNPQDANGLAAFTDGAGALGDLTGLLNDFPLPGAPTKLIQYDLNEPTNVTGINIFSGNGGGPSGGVDGRIFSTTVIRYSVNNGGNFSLLGYFQSDPSGSVNRDTGVPGHTEFTATLVQIFDDAAATMIAGVTNLQFDFYAVSNTQGQMHDPFGSDDDIEAMDPNLPININPFTEGSDGLKRAFESPLIWEIDVIGAPGGAADADFNGDGIVDGNDYLAWQRGFGATGNATPQQGDSNGDLNVDGVDLDNWGNQYGTPGPGVGAVPEPATYLGMLLALLALRRARFSGRA